MNPNGITIRRKQEEKGTHQMYNIAILDDNRIHLEYTHRIISDYLTSHQIEADVASFQDSGELLAKVSENVSFDVVFLDIELEEEFGIDVAKQINQLNSSIQIVFLTGHLHYATDIFETQHCYFVLKSELEERIPAVFDKLQTMMSKEILNIKVKSQHLILEQKEIAYIERDLRVSTIHCDGEDYRVSDKLADLLSQLNRQMFIRCHTSYIVNLNHIQQYRRQEIVLDHDIVIPVSRTYQKEVKRSLMEWAEKRL